MLEQQYQPPRNRFLFTIGIILPAISITVEATTHICAGVFFDPIPTIWHLLLVVFVPLAQLQVWCAIRRNAPDRLKLAGFLNAMVIGVSIFYSIVYIPVVPFGLLALMLAGLGILPLVPYLALITALVMRRQLKRIAAGAPEKSFSVKKRGLLAGLTLTLALLGLIELPSTLATIGLQMATASSPQMRTQGLRFLRASGSKDTLLRYCYNRTGSATDLIGSAFSIANPVTPAEAQKIYYKLTGETYDTAPRPQDAGPLFDPFNRSSFDKDQGGTSVGKNKLEGLLLADSKLTGTVDADGGVGYTEWTLVFANRFAAQREARAEVQLPPGGVVSRLTLWVNGEEREAAFAGRTQVRQAYEKVAIQQRRDPVLITTSGRDRILVQCFPVPPNGEMKIRFGVSVPLVLENPTRAKLLLPHFVNSNFDIPDLAIHAVRLEAKTPTWPRARSLMVSRHENTFIVSGSLRDHDLSEPDSAIDFDRNDVRKAWSPDPFDSHFVVTQSVEERTPLYLRRIVLVVDTSENMREYDYQIERALKSLPTGFDVKMILADSDGLYDSTSFKNFYADGPNEISTLLTYATFAGGADNAPALLKAWEIAAEKPGNNAIVWIHKPQRVLLRSVDELRARWQGPRYGPILYSVQTEGGPDEIEKKLDGIDQVKSVPRGIYLQTDLEQLFAQLTGQSKTLEFVRTSQRLDHAGNFAGAVKTSDHIVRLWANDEVTRILTPRDAALEDEATMLAVRYQLVTPVSGAVVLEDLAQYRAAGLEPVDPGTVPSIPEPEMVILLIVAGAFMIWLTFMKYRSRGSGGCAV
jgi:vault protein inter-alpha-trypsin-like protein